MKEHLSIFSSSKETLKGHWSAASILAILLYIGVVAAWETYLNISSPILSVRNDYSRWASVRDKASTGDECSVLIVGASRSQMSVDLDEMAKISPSRPLQLSVFASKVLPVLENLANDDTIIGSVLVSFEAGNFLLMDGVGDAKSWIDRYEARESGSNGDAYFLRYERWLGSIVDSVFYFRKDGGKPLDQFNAAAINRYTTMDSDGRVYGDFSLVGAKELYQRRIYNNDEVEPRAIIDPRWQADRLPRLIAAIEKIQSRGGNVTLLRFPSSKKAWIEEQVKYPESIYWGEVVARTSATTLHFTDFPVLSDFEFPDGIHLDYRDATAFTDKLSRIIFDEERFDRKLLKRCRK